MDKFNKLLIISKTEQQQNITLLAQSKGILTQQVTTSTALNSDLLKPGVLVAYPDIGSNNINESGLPIELALYIDKAALFLYQANRIVTDPMMIINTGIRGIIFRDEQPERVLIAINTMMSGQLYYSRAVMSEYIDTLLAQQRFKQHQQLIASDIETLTKQEKRIVELVAKGARNKEIAENLNISAHTVKAHMSSIFRKTNARNRVELLRCIQ